MADKLFRTYYNEKTESGTLPANSKILIQEGTDEPKRIDPDLIEGVGQLISVTEVGNTGFRLKGFNPVKFGDVGNSSIDLSFSSSDSNTFGATAVFSVITGGRSNTASEYMSVIGGGELNVASGQFSNISGGKNNTSLGSFSYINGGDGVKASSIGEGAAGLYNTNYTPANDSTDRLFSYGNGTNSSNRSDAYTLFKNGMQKFFFAALSTITNAVKGSVMLDENAMMHINDGTVWRKVSSINPVKVVTASTYTILSTDVNQYLEFSNACVVTLPLSLAANLEFQGEQTGTGEVSFVSAATGALNKFADFDNKTAGQFAPFGIRTKGSNVATLIGTLKLA
jgi:hypothetical protein